jgi:hypothetical protein
MFDRVSKLAEKTAVSLSRRRFLIGLGQGALSVAGVLIAASAGFAEAKVVSCVKGGSCCGGGTYYGTILHKPQNTYTYSCFLDSRCTMPGNCVSAAGSSNPCCGGTGYCLNAATCYSDSVCSVPC